MIAPNRYSKTKNFFAFEIWYRSGGKKLLQKVFKTDCCQSFWGCFVQFFLHWIAINTINFWLINFWVFFFARFRKPQPKYSNFLSFEKSDSNIRKNNLLFFLRMWFTRFRSDKTSGFKMCRCSQAIF